MLSYVGLIARILVLVLMWLVVIFMLWRRFRLDIDEHKIMAFGVWTLIFALWVGFGLRIWIGMLGWLIILGYFSQKNNWDGFEILDYFMPLLMIYLALDTWIFGLLGIIGYLVSSNFRKFRFYKSGKPGFGGMMTLGLLGIHFIIYGFKTDFADQVAGIWLLTGSLVGIYLRSRVKLVK